MFHANANSGWIDNKIIWMAKTKMTGGKNAAKQARRPLRSVPESTLRTTKSNQAFDKRRIQWSFSTGLYCSAMSAKRIDRNVMLVKNDKDSVAYPQLLPK